jgi:putative ABC transport system permease protein
MQHWSRVATRNWRAKPVRTAGAILAIALGTGAVVWVTCCYESVRQTVEEWAGAYVGNSHINIQATTGKYDTLPQRIVPKLEGLEVRIATDDRDEDGKRVYETIQPVSHAAPQLIRRVPSRVVKRADFEAAGGLDAAWTPTLKDLDSHGIDLAREPAVRKWEVLPGGRTITPTDQYACVLEASIAEEEGAGVGDYLLLWGTGDKWGTPTAFEIVGLMERRRIARFMKGVALIRLPILQQITNKQALINSVDLVLTEQGVQHIRRVATQIRRELARSVKNIHVRSAASRLEQIRKAQEQQRIVLVLMSCMALLTALFIILSTLSMGMIERITQLGLLRCVGMTRWQLGLLALYEVVPLGVVGVILGIPLGLGLTQLSAALVPDYVQDVVISYNGIGLAVLAGLAATLVAATLPAIASMTVSPLEATHPRARTAGVGALIIALLLAIGIAVTQFYIMDTRVQRDLQFVYWSAAAVALLYVVYALAAPLLVWLAGRVAVPIVAVLVGVRSKLLHDQVGRAVWRSAGICCGLMVGLSLIVGLLVFNRSFQAGWQFPKQFPEAYLWSFEQIDGDVAAKLADVPGIRTYTVANSPNVIVEERHPIAAIEQMYLSVTFFLGVEPQSFFELVQLKFVEGDPVTALAKLKEGGHVLVATDFARTRNKGVEEVLDDEGNVVVSNTVRVWFANRWETFKVAGVIDSPALDIAASYFQVQSEAQVAAVGSVIGSNQDLKERYGLDGARLVLLNFDLPPEPVPADWPPPRGTEAAKGLSHKHYDTDIPLARRWQNYRETHVLQDVMTTLDAGNAVYGTASELKDEIDAELTRMTYLLTAVPSVALLVAAIGVANLMTANITSRTKQIAVMRAVGATRSLILRMVVGEALVLGVLGSGLGLGLGIHLASDVTVMTERMWGYEILLTVPWGFVAVAVGLTVGLCMLAGIGPARHAARTNIIDALHVS